MNAMRYDFLKRKFFDQHDDKRFSRIPIHIEDRDQINGFVLRSDLPAQVRGNGGKS